MTIIDIIEKNVKAGKTSITIKSDTGKTAGIVTGLTRFKDMQANKQINYSKLLRDSGVWGCHKVDINNCYILENKVYLLRNMNPYRYYTTEEKEKNDAMYENFENAGIICIKCYFVA